MNKIGLFFGTETGTTRLIAKRIHKKLGEQIASKPLNVNRISPAEFLAHDALILGTPSYGEGDIPGHSAGCIEPNWEEFLAKLDGPLDLRGKRVALFGLGAQERYSERFASSLFKLYELCRNAGAEIIGSWSTEGYTFKHSAAVVDGRFVGLVIDERTQGMHTNARLDAWLDEVQPLLMDRLEQVA